MQLSDELRYLSPALIAFSGGVDSAFLLAEAMAAAPPDKMPMAVTTVSSSQTSESIENARLVAEELGVRWQLLHSDEFSDPEFLAGTQRRCYYCKRRRFGIIRAWAAEHPPVVGKWSFLEGSNADDLNDYRPGSDAARELNFHAPLADCGWTKKAIRTAALHRGLSCALRPADPCLVTRLAYGLTPSAMLLHKIELGENFLHQEGFSICRLRVDRARHVRIEVAPDQLYRLQGEYAENLLTEILSLGFDHAEIDPCGYVRGNMNQPTRDN